MKQIEITFPNGEVWQVPVDVVAEDMTQHYHHASDKLKRFWGRTGFVLNDALSDEKELILYLRYQMDWTVVMKYARLNGAVFQATYDYALMFDDATFAVQAGEA